VNWIAFLDSLHAMTESAAELEIDSMDDDDVLQFWTWNDREAAMAIEGEAPEEYHNMVYEFREALIRDVIAEIRYRSGGTL
jgi:hypothetical protein